MNEQQFTTLVKSAVLFEQTYKDATPANHDIKHQAAVSTVWRSGDVFITYNSNAVIDVNGDEHEAMNLSSTFGYSIEGVDVQDWMYGVCSNELDYTWNYDEVYAYLRGKQ